MLIVNDAFFSSPARRPTQTVSAPEISSCIAAPRLFPSVSHPIRRKASAKKAPCRPGRLRPAQKSNRHRIALTPFSGVLPWAGSPENASVTRVPSSAIVTELFSGPFHARAASRTRLRPCESVSISTVACSATTFFATPPDIDTIRTGPSGVNCASRSRPRTPFSAKITG